MTCLAKFDYFSKHRGVLNFLRNDLINLRENNDIKAKWYYGMNVRTGEEGIFPKIYVKIHQDSKLSYSSLPETTSFERHTVNSDSFRINSISLRKQISGIATNLKSNIQQLQMEQISKKPEKIVDSVVLNLNLLNGPTPLIPIFKNGFLYYSEKPGKWEEKWVVLFGNQLGIYKKKYTYDISLAQSTIDLKKVISVQYTNFQNNKFKKANSFQLITLNKTYYFATSSVEEGNELIWNFRIIKIFFQLQKQLIAHGYRNDIYPVLEWLNLHKKNYDHKIEEIKKKLMYRNVPEQLTGNYQKSLFFLNQCLVAILEWTKILIILLYFRTYRHRRERETAIVRKTYNSLTKGELSLKEFDFVTILEAHQDEWWLGELNGIVGWFSPENCHLILRDTKLKNSNNHEWLTTKFVPKLIEEFGIEHYGSLFSLIEGKKNKLKKYYCKLIEEKLLIYSNEDSIAHKYFLNVCDFNSITNANIKSNRKHSFELIGLLKSEIFCAQNEKEYQKWNELLQITMNCNGFTNLIQFNDIEEHKIKMNSILNFIENEIEIIKLIYENFEKEKIQAQKEKKENEIQEIKIENIKNKKRNKENLNTETNHYSFNPYSNLAQRLFYYKKKYNNLIRSRIYVLEILARLNFPNLRDKEVGYAIESNKQTLTKEELKFKKRQWFILRNEVDELFLQVETGNEIGLAPRSKIEIIDLKKIHEIFSIPKRTLKNEYLSDNQKNSDQNKELETQRIRMNLNNNSSMKSENAFNNQNTPTTKSSIQKNNLKNQFEKLNTNKQSKTPILDLHQLVELESKSGKSFPIFKKGFIKILINGKFIKKQIRIKSWFFGFYDNEKSIQPSEVIDFRRVISYYLDSDSKKTKCQFKLRIRGGLTETLRVNTQNEVLEWFQLFGICKLFQELSHPEKDNENFVKRNNQFNQLIDWIRNQLNEIHGRLNNTSKNNNKILLNFHKKNDQKKHLLKELKLQIALLNTWKKKILSRAARFNIKDDHDNKIRIYCLKDYIGDSKKNELNLKKNEWLILIQKPVGGILKAEKGNQTGNVNSDCVDIVMPIKAEEKIELIDEFEFEIESFLMKQTRHTFETQFSLNNENENQMNIEYKSKDYYLKILKNYIKKNNIKLNENLDFYSPIFFNTQILQENKIGQEKWRKKTLAICDWYLLIMKKNHAKEIIDIRKIISIEQSPITIGRHHYCFLIYLPNKEYRFVVNNSEICFKWMNSLKILKTFQNLISAFEMHSFNYFENRLYKILNWINEEIFSLQSQQNIAKKVKEITNQIEKKIIITQDTIHYLEKWRNYLISRYCRFKMLKDINFDNIDDENEYKKFSSIINDSEKRILCDNNLIHDGNISNDIDNENNNNNKNKQNNNNNNNNNNNIPINNKNENNGATFANNKDFYLFDKIIDNENCQIILNNNQKKVIPIHKIEIITPQLIDKNFEFKKLFDKINTNKKLTNNNEENNINNKNNNENNNDNKNIKKENEQGIEKQSNTNNYVGNENDDEDEDLLFYKSFILNNLPLNERIILTQNILDRFVYKPNSLLNFPINYSNKIFQSQNSNVNKLKLIERWGILKGWILMIKENSKSENIMQVFDLRTILRIKKNISNTESCFIIIFKSNKEIKFYTEKPNELFPWTTNISAIINFLYFLNPIKENENISMRIIRIKAIYNWIRNEIIELEKEKETNEKLLQLTQSFEKIYRESNLQNSIFLATQQLTVLYLWRHRVLLKIAQIQYQTEIKRYKNLAFIHTNNNEFNQIKEINNKKLLNYNQNDWVGINDLNNRETLSNQNYYYCEKLIYNNSNEKELKKESGMGMGTGMRMGVEMEIEKEQEKIEGLICTNNLYLFDKEEFNEKIEFDFTKIGKRETFFKFGKNSIIKNQNQNQIPVFNSGYLMFYKTGLVSSKWNKWWIILDGFELKLFSNTNDREPKKTINISKIKSIEFINQDLELSENNENNDKETNKNTNGKNENVKNINDQSIHNTESKIIKIHLENKFLQFICNEKLKELNWVESFTVLLNFKEIERPIKEIENYNLLKRQKTFEMIRQWIEKEIDNYNSRIKTLLSMKNIYSNDNDDDDRDGDDDSGGDDRDGDDDDDNDDFIIISNVNNNNDNDYDYDYDDDDDDNNEDQNYNNGSSNNNNSSIKKEINEIKLFINNLEEWRGKILSKLLRFRIQDPTNFWSMAFMMIDLHVKEELITLNKNEWVKIVPTNQVIASKTLLEKNGKQLWVNNDHFLRIAPSKAEIIPNHKSQNQNLVNKKNGLLLSFEIQEGIEELIFNFDYKFIKFLINNLPSSDYTSVSKSLIELFITRNKLQIFLIKTIEWQCERIKNENTLFRTDSIESKSIAWYFRANGLGYLSQMLNNTIEEIINCNKSFEIMKSKLKENECLIENQKLLTHYVFEIFNQILNSILQVPLPIRNIIYHLARITNKKFPDSKYLIIAGFFFLRFLTPAVVVPESINPKFVNISTNSRRALILISKVIQTIANRGNFKEINWNFANCIETHFSEKLKKFMDLLVKPVYIVNLLNNKEQKLVVLYEKEIENLFFGYLLKDEKKVIRKFNKSELDLNSSILENPLKEINFENIDKENALKKIYFPISSQAIKNKFLTQMKNETQLMELYHKVIIQNNF
ncbi:ras gtpase-activating protein [Anaeramoeba flamelloides]|uniref:Ras gtpase-activating protein n=1 Tax=Anaeramoeba flamelloides TaxID=1746091 RepID=A0ABQ8XZY6_9EUKA|nr:ras gtpase-activating protein [Anaeramoeba flamelloides]